MMGDHIPQRAGGSSEGAQRGGPQDSDDEVDSGQLWDPQHQVEYLRLAGEFGGELSPQPSSSAECEHRVSPLDPNLSSAARYSPPPPYSSPMAGIEPSLEHPDSPMEDLSHSSSLPIIPTGVSSSISSATESLVHSEPHRLPLPQSSAGQVSGSRTSSFVSTNSLFSAPPSLPQSQPRWGTHHVICDDDNEEENETPALGESVWAKQKRLALRSIVGRETSQPGSSGLQSISPANPSVFMNNPLPGPSGVQAVLQPSSSCAQNQPNPGSNDLRNVPQPSPSNLDALPSSNKISAQHNESDSSDSDGDVDHDSSEGLPQLCSTLGSGARGRMVHLSDGEAEALSGPASGCEASSSMRGHVTPLSSPSTPADNCIVSSSTGHIDSVPPTPAEFQGNDVSGPCSPVSPSLASVAILDSTVDSTSGREIVNSEGQSSEDETDDRLTASGHIELPVMVDEAEEISTSEVDLQHSDDSQDVALLVNPQGMFANGRGGANRFMEHLSLSLSHFSSNSLDPGISGIGNEHRIPPNSLAPPPDPTPYLATAGPSGAPLPCSSQTVNRQAGTPPHQSRDRASISSTHSLPDAVEVLDSSLPLLDISSGLPECSTVSDADQLSNGTRSQALDESTVRIEDESKGLEENQHEIDPLVSLADTVNDSVNSESLAVDSENQDYNQLPPSYVLELHEESSTGSDDALSSGSCEKGELVNTCAKKRGYQSPVTSHQSLLEPETVTVDSLDNSLGLSLTSSQPRKDLESDAALPGTSQQPALTQQLMPSQPSQVSLLVGGSDDSNDGALLMMVASHPCSLQSSVALEKPLEEGERRSAVPRPGSPLPQNIPCEAEKAHRQSTIKEGTNSSKQKVTATAQHREVEVEFIGADFWCGECEHMYTHECPTHHLQDCDKSGRTRAWASLSGQDVISHKPSGSDGCVDCEQINNLECSQHHIQAISDKPVRARAWASLPGQHLAIRKIAGTEEFGVFTRKVIPKRTRFGPLEGVMTEDASSILPSSGLIYSVLSGGETFFLDTSDEGSSNWMRFVRKATNYLEQNCVVMQIEGSLVFLTSTDILPRSELRVGYSKQYASQRNLHSLEPTQHEISVLESMRKSWPCYECDEGFESSAELQQHLTCHDEATGEEERKKRKRLKTRRPRSNGEAETSVKKVVKRIKVSEEAASSGSSQTEGKSHLHGNGGDKLQHHKCVICSRAFSLPELLKIHLRSHQNVEIKEEDSGMSMKQESKTCPLCSKVFESEVELSSHVEDHSMCLPVSNKPYKCDFCYKSFLRPDRLEAHTAVHSNEAEKPYHCNLCLRRFCSNSALNTHIKFHIEGSKGYDCPICREGFFSVASLKAHVSTHCVNEQYKCPTCNKVFPTYSKIRRHIRSYHAILPHTCSICSKEMPSVDKLKIHMLSHSDRRDYLCQDCGKRFKRKDKMREHSKRMHSSERDARASKAATKAPPKFVPKVDPTDYMQFEYKCHTCLLGFKRRGMLVNHLAKRHPNVDMTSVPELNQPILKTTRCYYCQYCDKMYRSSSKRKLHILKYHPGEELPPSSTTHKENRNGEDSSYSQTVGSVTTYPHPCKWCYRQYASRARLLRHQRHQHPDVGGDSSSIKDYGEDMPEPGVSDMEPLLDGGAGITGEIPLGGQIVAEGSLLRNHRLGNLPRGEPSTSGVQGPEDDLLTQAMGEITPLGNGDQYVRLIGTGSEGQQVMVGTTQANRPLLVSGDGGQQGTTLALVTTDSADTVTLSLPAGQFISLIPGLSVSGPASVMTAESQTTSSGRESAHLNSAGTQEENGAANQELQGEILSTIRMGPSLNKEDSIEQVVLATHQSAAPASSVVWQQALSFNNTST